MKATDARFRPVGMGWWVDPRICSVRVADARAYLLGRGWRTKPQAQPEMFFIERAPEAGNPPPVLTLPPSEEFGDYLQRITELITTLASFERRYAVEVLEDILRHAAPAEPARDGKNQVRGPASRGGVPS